jgi:chromosome segregation ATPase
MSDDTANLHAIIAAAIAPLAAQIDHLFAEQQNHAQSLARATARLDELAQELTDLRGDRIWFEHRAEGAERAADRAHSIVMQAEHQMQREVASVNERLLDVTADLHRLHLIRESPEHELYRLRSEIAVLQRRLEHVEGADAPQ